MRKFAPIAAVLGFIGSAQAAVPASVTTAMTDAATDVAVVAGLGLAVAIAVYGFKKMKSAL